ncbi:MAG: WXG100 family type VII secretion target [Micrococcales bacterium]|nr:WXG100 family type VII secretion target [Micrococcales bacterium]
MFHIQSSAVNALGECFRTEATGIQGDLDNLDAKVRQVLGQWDGAAQAAYQTAQADWTKKMAEMQTCLMNISTRVGQIVESYNDADRRGANLF